MKTNSLLFAFCLAAICLLSACQEPTIAEQIRKTDDGLFRGLSLGDSKETILALEGEPNEEEGKYIKYTYTIENEEGRDGEYELSYKLHNSLGLVEMTLVTNLPNELDATELYDLFKADYKSKLGDVLNEGETSMSWEFDNDKFKGINVNLHNTSKDWGYGRVFLNVQIWPPPKDEE